MTSLLHETVKTLFRAHFGGSPKAIVEVAGDGSARRYFRLFSETGETVIGVVGPDPEENQAFLSFARAFRSIGLPVPEIYRVDEEAGAYLEEDLGDTTLFDALSEARDGERFPEEIAACYRKVLDLLPRFQIEGGKVIDYSVAYPRVAFDARSIHWDLNYFKYHFLKLAHLPFNEERLQRDFDHLTEFLLAAGSEHFLYRDFQSRNVMLRDGEPWFIDFQGGRRGALQYDVASLLYDAKADIPEEVREEFLQYYVDRLESFLSVDRELFRRHYRGFVLVRIMQAMGAYGYRGFFERKPRFLQSVPYAATNLRMLVDEGLPLDLPELELVFRRIADRWAGSEAPLGKPTLTVHIGSFSYTGGYPEDRGEHGGGFVFDCRALPNPGRDPRYEDLVGTDPEVVEFMETSPETEEFWQSVRSIVDRQVETYLEREFTSLTVTFGCTGGQHRSVYFAERMADHVREHFPQVKPVVEHRETDRWPTREAAAGGGHR